jgi:hypothetical protein
LRISEKKTLPRRDLLLTSRQDVVFRFAMEATASYLPVEGLQAQDSTSIYIYDIHTCMSDMKEKLKNLVREKSSVRSFFWARPADICWHLLTASGSFSYWQENKPEVKKCEGWAAECGPEISPPNRRKFPESDVLIEWRTSFAWSCNDVSNLLNSFQKLILTLSHLFFLKLFSPLLRSLHLFSSLLNSCQLFSPCALLRSTVFPLLCSTLLYSTLFYSILLYAIASTQVNSAQLYSTQPTGHKTSELLLCFRTCQLDLKTSELLLYFRKLPTGPKDFLATAAVNFLYLGVSLRTFFDNAYI